MKIEVDKKYIIGIISVMLIIAGSFFVMSSWANANGVGHSADEINLSGFCLSNGTGCPASSTPQHFSGGYYGYCVERWNEDAFSPHSSPQYVTAPATVTGYYYCSCPSGYTKVTGIHRPNINTNWKEYLCMKN